MRDRISEVSTKEEASSIGRPSQPDPARSKGSPLPGALRREFEARYAHDFGQVRIHRDQQAADATRSLGALAFTLGSDISFAPSRYAPDSREGKRLLAHELAHVVQQAPGVEQGSAGAPGSVRVGEASSPAELAADSAAREVMTGFGGSPSSRIRDRLRASRPSGPVIQRALTTWAGEWSADKYAIKKDAAGASVGADIELRFKPGAEVDATKIGMLQIARSQDSGKTYYLNATVQARSIAKGAGEGYHLDQLGKYSNPLYATGATKAKDTLASTATSAAWGQHGFHYVDAGGALHSQDALLKDAPSLGTPNPDSAQTFETSALALTGVQQGTYYGSVKWGWSTDAAGVFKLNALRVQSKDAPSNVFHAARRLWNSGKTTAGADTLDVYGGVRRYVNADGVQLSSDPATMPASLLATLDKNTRVQVTRWGVGEAFNAGLAEGARWVKVTVVTGAQIGVVGWMVESQLAGDPVP